MQGLKELTAEGLIATFEYCRKGQGMKLCPELLNLAHMRQCSSAIDS